MRYHIETLSYAPGFNHYMILDTLVSPHRNVRLNTRGDSDEFYTESYKVAQALTDELNTAWEIKTGKHQLASNQS